MNRFTGVSDFDDLFSYLVDSLGNYEITHFETKEKYPMTIKEDTEGLTIEFEVPRKKKEDIKVTYKKNIITVSIKDVTRKGSISEKYDITKLTTKLDAGILTLFVPLSEEEKKAEVTVDIQ